MQHNAVSAGVSFSNILTTKRVRTSASNDGPKLKRADSSGGSVSKKRKNLIRADASSSSLDRYSIWRRNLPILYDAIIYHGCASLSCTFAKRPARVEEFSVKRLVYYSTRTTATYSTATKTWDKDGKPGMLYVGELDTPSVNSSRRKFISRFIEGNRSSRVSVLKTIIHPGEVNRIRTSSRHESLIATHTDSEIVFLWDVDKQEDRDMGGKQNEGKSTLANVPTLALTGHKAKAEFALEFSRSSDHLLSGGSDNLVCLWDLADYGSSSGSAPSNGYENTLEAAHVFEGHTAPVEGCCFHPTDGGSTCASVGDDKRALFWDTRVGNQPVVQMDDIHEDDINCCSWNPHDERYFVTGSSDNNICLFDLRQTGTSEKPTVLKKLNCHNSPVLNVQWSPHNGQYLAVSGEENLVTIYDLGPEPLSDIGSSSYPLAFFKHAGHKTPVVDFDWNTEEPFSFLTVSDDNHSDDAVTGGCMQFWRVTEFLTRASDPDFVEELENIYNNKEN
mmetsp:Transcript_13287/g.21698  ORF Transcript_13287/g.21698 Transcript_13287/m.21698 type:complete len:503 (+) Transcript_13287:169-1677(+)|eukprot:CAMPEP_0203759874 /NCGR_PEP_ID=MMETSP0098-20131031/13184_1 /ASSEMBLY_ACC=CAM_ASM_000208 /TAXON_ID=96639 /ORGANISM=" , Strain NY0313808BC1" /LENGTH=502 /DNA_ID=CAMNT_0050653173 /DNA_START=180 /DNA_END=1685 /DNA_ORIENTATION=-